MGKLFGEFMGLLWNWIVVIVDLIEKENCCSGCRFSWFGGSNGCSGMWILGDVVWSG